MEKFLILLLIIIQFSFTKEHKSHHKNKVYKINDYIHVDDISFPNDVIPEVGGLAFNEGGELFVALRRHGILFAKPVDNPKKFKWKYFSRDSFHNIGGILAEGKRTLIISTMRELMRVRDTDNDDIADEFKIISQDWGVTGNYHETSAGPILDEDGNFFLSLITASFNGPTSKFVRGKFSEHGRRGRNFSAADKLGCIIKITPNGKTSIFAYGLRSPNGLFWGKDKQLYVSDNEGDWRGANPIYAVSEGDFLGHPPSLVWKKDFVKKYGSPVFVNKNILDKMRRPPVIVLPKGVAYSLSEFIKVPKGVFGIYEGQIFLLDQSSPRIFRFIKEKINGKIQGAIIPFIDGDTSIIRSGNNRLVFAPNGDLFIGQTMRGWGNPVEGLQRIRWLNKTPMDIQTIKVHKKGFLLSFTKEIDKRSLENFVENCISYNHSYGHHYGSPKSKKKFHQIELKLVNNKQILLKIKNFRYQREKLRTPYIYEFKLSKKLRSLSGENLITDKFFYTLKTIPK